MSNITTELANKSVNFGWEDIYVLNPNLGIRPDNGRALIFNRDVLEFRRGRITTERAIMTALLDGKRSFDELASTVEYLFDLSPEESKQTVISFIESGLSTVSKGLTDDVIVNVKDVAQNVKIPKYDPEKFASAGANWSSERKLKSPITITWMLSSNCYTNCIYCYANRRPISTREHLSDSRCREIIQEIIDLEIPVVSLTGGDPLMNKHALDYIEMMLKANIGVELPTKVPLNKKQISRLAKMGLDEIQISIDGPNAAICDFMVQVPGWFDRIVETIRLLVEAGIRVRTNTILTSHNISYAEETALLLYSLEVKQIKLTNYNRSIYHHSESFWVPRAEAESLLKKMDYLRERCPNAKLIYSVEKDFSELSVEEKKLNWPPPPSCSAFVDTLVICPDGSCVATEEMMQCQQYVLGNLKAQTIQEVWNSERFHRVHHPPKDLFKGTVCFNCEEFDKCHYEWGYCFRDSYKAYGSFYTPSPNCPKAPVGQKLMGPIG